MIGHQALELFAGVLAALVGMMHQFIGSAAPPDRHDQGIGDQIGGHRILHRPADNAPCKQVEHHRKIEPTFGGPDVGEVGDPFSVRPICLEVPL